MTYLKKHSMKGKTGEVAWISTFITESRGYAL